ncbi:fibronectin type III domain-containing protein [Halopiger thermotolerans]
MTLDATVQSEITANWDDTINYGEYRIEWKEEDPDTTTSYSDSNSAVVGHDTLAYTITGLLDGEKYSVRLRTQTEHKTGNWLEAADITKLVAADQPTISSTSTTSVSISWSLNSTFEGSQQIYRKRTDYSYPDGDPGRLVGTVSASATSFTDDTVQPDREYFYMVRALTQWVHADSPAQTATTTSIGLEDRAVPSRGPHIEVDQPDRDAPLTPDLLDITRNPTANGYPTVELSVPFRRRWHDDALNDAPMRVWYDGDREPVDRLEHRSLKKGKSSKQTSLTGKGGTELETQVTEDVDVEKTHVFVERLINDYTSYTANVDTPQTETGEKRRIQEADSTVELEQALTDAVLEQIRTDETLPLEIVNGEIVPLQTCQIIELSSEHSDGSYTGGSAGEANFSLNFDFGYSIPDGEVGIALREGILGSDVPDIDFDFNGANLATISMTSTSSPGWFDLSYAYSGSFSSGSLVAQEATQGSNPYIVDLAVVYDQRYHDSSNFDNSVHESGGHLDSPWEYPNSPIRIELEPITTPLAISEVFLEVTTNDANGVAELSIGIDGTTDYDTVTNATSHSLVYNELNTTARTRVGLGARTDLDPQASTPRYGYQPQTLDYVAIDAILDDTPVITNRSFDEPLIEVLRECADIGNFVFEVQQQGDETSIEWTQLKQRATNDSPDLTKYKNDKQTEDVVDHAIVYGGAQRVTRQSVTVSVGSWVDLPFPDSRLVDGKTTVYSGDTEFKEGEDYEIQRVAEDGQPKIKALSGGSISDGQTISVDADVKPRGEYIAGDVVEDDVEPEIEDIPGLASKQMCDQVALFLVEETGDAVSDVSFEIPRDSVEWSVINAIDLDELPGDGPYQIKDISHEPDRITGTLGIGQSAGDLVQEISTRVGRNSERV